MKVVGPHKLGRDGAVVLIAMYNPLLQFDVCCMYSLNDSQLVE